MKYECFGEAKRLAIAAYEDGKQWHQLVIDTQAEAALETVKQACPAP